MSSIEEKALALASEWERRFATPTASTRRRALVEIFTMLVTEQEAHEADKQAFSDAVDACIEHIKTGASGSSIQALGALSNIERILSRFIIKKPDPLESAWNEVWDGDYGTPKGLDDLRQALAARGLGVARIGEVVEGQKQ